ncbi:MAG TPA: TetR/AcrR family transcriptional regulator [Solirubrobacterales bacterium]
MTTSQKRLSAERRRELILDGAVPVFGERGYEGASMTAIAEAAGITPAVIYDHFSSKAELQIELLERQTAQLLEFVGAALAAAPEDLEARLRAGADAYFRFVEEHRSAWRMLFRDPPTDPGVAAAYRRLQGEATSAIAAFIEANAGEALERQDDPRQAAEMFAELLKQAQNGLAFWWYDHPEVSRAEVVDRLLEFCWTGLRAVAGERGQ